MIVPILESDFTLGFAKPEWENARTGPVCVFYLDAALPHVRDIQKGGFLSYDNKTYQVNNIIDRQASKNYRMIYTLPETKTETASAT